MSSLYRHPTYGAVTLLRNFGHYVTVATENAGKQNVSFSSLSPIDAPIPFPTPGAAIAAPGEDAAPTLDEEDTSQGMQVNTVRLAINKANANLISKQLPHIGKLRARQIVAARPEGGFASFKHLQEAIPDLFGDGGLACEEWLEIEPLISYES